MVWQGQYDKLFVDGEWVAPASDRVFRIQSPTTEEVIGTVPEGVEADIDRAVVAARRAFDNGPWPRMDLTERVAIMTALAAQFDAHTADIAELVTAELGCPITLSTGMQAVGPRLVLEALTELAPRYPWSDTRNSITGKALVTREPVGVVAAVVPWNAPLLTTMIKIAPALLAGCTVILKPAPNTPLSAYLLAEMASAAGMPAGVLNIVAADREASEHLVRHPQVDKVSFTGSTAAGRRIASICGNDLRRCTLELGGKSAAVLLDDADLDVVIPSIRALSLRNSGQVCSNKTRIVVARSRRDDLLDRLKDMLASMPVGDPTEATTEIGPMVSAVQRDRVAGYIDGAIDSGEKLLIGGKGAPDGLDRGWFVRPTIFADVDPGAKIAQEEIFGPVLTVHTFDSEAEAIDIANNSDYGLNGSVFAADPQHALSVARQIRTGTVELNGKGVGFHAPIGGFKSSGIGREGGLEGFDAYVELKSYGLTDDLYAELS